jgi:hypothetical protein
MAPSENLAPELEMANWRMKTVEVEKAFIASTGF